MDAVIDAIGGNIIECTQSIVKVHSMTCMLPVTFPERRLRCTGSMRCNRRRIFSSIWQAHEPREPANPSALDVQQTAGQVTLRVAAGGGGGVRGDGGERGMAARARAVPAQGPGHRSR